MTEAKTGTSWRRLAAAGGVALFLLAGEAPAAPLGLTQRTPDVYSDYLQVAFVSATQALTADGFAIWLENPAGTKSDIETAPDSGYAGSFQLQAQIGPTGTATGGSLTVWGSIFGQPAETLLSSTHLVGFGYYDEETLEFLFGVDGGSLAPLFGSAVGVILDGTGFAGSFSEDFENLGNARADTFPVPEPSSALLLLLGAGLYRRGRRKSRAA